MILQELELYPQYIYLFAGRCVSGQAPPGSGDGHPRERRPRRARSGFAAPLKSLRAFLKLFRIKAHIVHPERASYDHSQPGEWRPETRATRAL